MEIAQDRYSDAYCGEKQLIHAFLERAILDCLETHGISWGVTRPTKIDRRNAREFIQSESIEPFSFRWCCEILFEDPERMIEGTRNYIEKPGAFEDFHASVQHRYFIKSAL